MSEIEEIKKLLPYSCKVSTDQKCVKIDTHVYADSSAGAVHAAFEMWLNAKKMFQNIGVTVAPLDQ